MKPRPIRWPWWGRWNDLALFLTTSETGKTEGGQKLTEWLTNGGGCDSEGRGITQNANLRVWFCSAVFLG